MSTDPERCAAVAGLIDVHCHLNSGRLPDSAERLVEEARAAGVDRIIMAGVRPSGWQEQRELATRIPGVYGVYGLHPWLAGEAAKAPQGLDGVMARLDAMLTTQPRPVAVGETGLDGYTPERRATLPEQEASLRRHLAMARRHQLPVVLHILKAHERALAVLREVGVPDAGGLVHSFSGSAEVAEQYVRLGLHISFCGTLTNPQSRRLRSAATAVPASRLLIETDAPDQPPHLLKGRPNRPANLPYVARALATVRAVSLDEVARTTTENACRLFRLPAA